MEFLQVPETPAPEPAEPDVPDCCGEEKIGELPETNRSYFVSRDCVREALTVCVAEGAENHNGEDDSSESDADDPGPVQEPKAPRNPSTGGGSQPGSAVHRARGTPPSRRATCPWGRLNESREK